GYGGCPCSPCGRWSRAGRSTPTPASRGPSRRPRRASRTGWGGGRCRPRRRSRFRCDCRGGRREPPATSELGGVGPLEAHPVAVTVLVVALVGVAVLGRHTRLAHNDDA